jgi:chromosomal replication initiation ATPase DnaA
MDIVRNYAEWDNSGSNSKSLEYTTRSVLAARRSRAAARRALCERISESCAAAWMSVPLLALRQANRCKAPVASARQAAIYFAHVVFEENLTRAGGIFGRDRTTARHACSRMEDLRDDPRIDQAFDVMEAALLLWVDAFASEEQA